MSRPRNWFDRVVGQTALLEDPIEAAARAFDHDNPWIYHRIVQMARAYKDAGNARGSIAQIFEVLRWERETTTNAKQFKLNNSFRAYYARKVMANNPDLDGFFRTRAIDADLSLTASQQ